MKNKYYILCEKLLVENHKECYWKNFAKQEFWKVEHVTLFFVKHNSTFWARYYDRKNDIFAFTDVLSLISFLKKSLG